MEMAVAAELAELGVRPASTLRTDVIGRGADRRLPVLPALGDLLPDGLSRGSTVAVVTRAAGATTLLLALLAEPSRTSAWCAVVGMPALSLAAASAMGVDLDRLAWVPHPGVDAAAVAATLLDGFDMVVLATGGGLAPGVCSQLSARARQSGSILVTTSAWTGAAMTIAADGGTWFGRRRLRCRRLTVTVSGRGSATQPRRAEVWLPGDPVFQATLPQSGDLRRLQVVR
jgi:hypothetical protein